MLNLLFTFVFKQALNMLEKGFHDNKLTLCKLDNVYRTAVCPVANIGIFSQCKAIESLGLSVKARKNELNISNAT